MTDMCNLNHFSAILEFDMLVQHNYMSTQSAHLVEIHIFSSKYMKYHSLVNWTVHKPTITQEAYGILIKVGHFPT